jgi:hypothetical protein
MMKKLIIFGALVASTSAWAQTPASAPATAASLDPNQILCRNVAETGSRLSHTRICKTRIQWAEEARLTRQSVEQDQSNLAARQKF